MSDNEMLGLFVLAAMVAASVGLGFIVGPGWGFVLFAFFMALIVAVNRKKGTA